MDVHPDGTGSVEVSKLAIEYNALRGSSSGADCGDGQAIERVFRGHASYERWCSLAASRGALALRSTIC